MSRPAQPRASIVALVVLAVTTCATRIPQYVFQMNPSPRKLVPRHPDTVELFTSTRPQAPYVDVAVIQVDAYSGVTGGLSALVREAARHGCDGVIVGGTGVRGPTSEEAAIASLFNSRADKNSTVWGTCIVYETVPPEAPVVNARPAPPAPGGNCRWVEEMQAWACPIPYTCHLPERRCLSERR